ncbi:MAG: hypothetical protein JNL01_06305 [Bdellovibrionales bacterium]|nr:hypothetical protein [Bdellovibrionales bacterium]
MGTRIALSQGMLKLGFISTILIALISDASGSTEMLFRPDLEIPSKHSISSAAQERTQNRYPELFDHFEKAFPEIYNSLSEYRFQVSEIVEPIRLAAQPEMKACAEQPNREVSLEDCASRAIEPIVATLRAKEYFDDPVATALLNPRLYLVSKPQDPFIQQYWNSLSLVQVTRKTNETRAKNPYQRRARFRRDLGNEENLTPREFLYKRYTFAQIGRMSQLIEIILKIQSSERGSIDIDYDGDGKADYKRELGFEERFRFGEDELNRLVQEWNIGDKVLAKTGFSKTDLMTAGLETGVIDMDLLQRIAEITDMNDPRPRFFRNLLHLVKSVGTAALMINPATAVYATTGIIFLNTLEEVKNAKKQRAGNIVF